MTFDEVITLTPDQAAMIGDILTGAAAAQYRVRVATDDGGVKIAVGRHTWSPPIGTQLKNP